MKNNISTKVSIFSNSMVLISVAISFLRDIFSWNFEISFGIQAFILGLAFGALIIYRIIKKDIKE